MKHLKFILVVLSLVNSASSFAAKTATDPEIQIFATDDQGKPKPQVQITRDADTRDILFKHSVPEKYKSHVSWAFEISDPKAGVSFQTSLEGGIPAILHWDGYFGDGSDLKLNQRYYMRILLVFEDGSSVVSPWSFFSVRYRSRSVVLKSQGDTISLYLVPAGAALATIAMTGTQEAMVFPVYSGDMGAVLHDTHTMGIKMEASSNTLFGIAESAPAFIYSEASIYYRYRLIGAPLRAPVLPLVPGNMGFKYRPAPRSDAWGQVQNMGIGLRFFHTVLRGSLGAAAIDAELFRAADGFALTFDYDHAFSWLRVRTGAQVGYSLLAGRVFMMQLETALTYERIYGFAPGLLFRYQLFSGNPPATEYNAANNVTNQLVSMGAVVYFKF